MSLPKMMVCGRAHVRLLSILLLALVATATVAQREGPQPGRPEEPRDGLRLAEFPVHDPYILAHEPTRTYYLYTSAGPRQTGERRYGVMAYRSRDLKSWSGPHVVFTIPDGAWANPMHGAWAPEVHEYRGRYYLFVTLHNNDAIFAEPPQVWRENHLRGSVIAVGDSPDGPFELLTKDGPHPPRDFMTLDGTLYVDPDGRPWMVYCHEWIQKIDGTVEAIRLSDDLATTVGRPIQLFRGSDAPWLNASLEASNDQLSYVTDGCQLYRSKTGELLMLWSAYERGSYVQTQARSASGSIEGPWVHLEPLVKGDSGHGMLFRSFEGELLLVLHQPFQMPRSRAKIYEIEDLGDSFRVVRARDDLHGPDVAIE